MTADELNAQLDSAANVIRTAIPFINALFAAYDAKPVTSGIDPAAIQAKVDEFNSAASDLAGLMNSRAVPSNASGG